MLSVLTYGITVWGGSANCPLEKKRHNSEAGKVFWNYFLVASNKIPYLFCFAPLQLSGLKFFTPPGAHAIFEQSNVLYNNR